MKMWYIWVRKKAGWAILTCHEAPNRRDAERSLKRRGLQPGEFRITQAHPERSAA